MATLNHAGYYEVSQYEWVKLNNCWLQFQKFSHQEEIKNLLQTSIPNMVKTKASLSTTKLKSILNILEGFLSNSTINTSNSSAVDMLLSLYMSRNYSSDGVLVYTPSTITDIWESGSIEKWVSNKSNIFKNLRKPKVVAIIYSNSNSTSPVTIFFVVKSKMFHFCDHLIQIETSSRKQRNRLGLAGVLMLNAILGCMPVLSNLSLIETAKYINFSSKTIDVQSAIDDAVIVKDSAPIIVNKMEGAWKIRDCDIWIGSTVPFYLM